jgi:uncharacterized integral membrane protein
MRAIRRLLAIVIFVPIAIVLVALAVANRQPVVLALDPFSPAEPAASVVLPFYLFLLVALILGVLIGGIASWLRQSRHRREERRFRAELARREREVEDLRRRLADGRAPLAEGASRELTTRQAA